MIVAQYLIAPVAAGCLATLLAVLPPDQTKSAAEPEQPPSGIQILNAVGEPLDAAGATPSTGQRDPFDLSITESLDLAPATEPGNVGSSLREHSIDHLLDRVDSLEEIVFSPAELHHRKYDVTSLVRRAQAGKPLSQDELRELRDEVNTLEQRAVEQLAAEYRVQVYDTFHKDREEFDRRRDNWLELEYRWKQNANPEHYRGELIEWLTAARDNSTDGNINELPTWPSFAGIAGPRIASDVVPADQSQGDDGKSDDSFAGATDALHPEITNSPREDAQHPSFARPPINAQPKDKSSAPVVTPPLDRATGGGDAAAGPIASATSPGRPDVANGGFAGGPRTIHPTRPSQDPYEPVVNIDELRSRIVGQNFGVAALEEELRSRNDWNAQSLQPLVGDLADFYDWQKTLNLYLRMVPRGDQTTLAPLDPLDKATRLLTDAIVAARSRAQQESFGTPEQRQHELSRLSGLSQQVSQFAEWK